jgi:deoxyribodipyrimidine photo-lyase
MKKAIVWFRQDLRVNNNVALYEAYKDGYQIILLYILDEEMKEGNKYQRKIGAAQKWWLHYSLKSLEESFKNNNAKLYFKKGTL